jgi:hypothetical protein
MHTADVDVDVVVVVDVVGDGDVVGDVVHRNGEVVAQPLHPRAPLACLRKRA